jgi:hypothetical protein
LFKCFYNNDLPGISKKNEFSCTTPFKIYNFSCINFSKKNQPKYTTNGVLTAPSTNAILEKWAGLKTQGSEL